MDIDRYTYRQLDELLLSLGFTRKHVEPKWRRYDHAPSDTVIIVIEKRSNELVRLSDAVSARLHLVEKGLITEKQLAARLAECHPKKAPRHQQEAPRHQEDLSRIHRQHPGGGGASHPGSPHRAACSISRRISFIGSITSSTLSSNRSPISKSVRCPFKCGYLHTTARS